MVNENPSACAGALWKRPSAWIFFAGEGFPPRASPRVISPTVRCMGGCRRRHGRASIPGRPFRGYRLHCPPPGWFLGRDCTFSCVLFLPAVGRGGPRSLHGVKRAITSHRAALRQCKRARYRGRQDKGNRDLPAPRQEPADPLRRVQNTGFLKYFSAPGLCRSSSLKKCSASSGLES